MLVYKARIILPVQHRIQAPFLSRDSHPSRLFLRTLNLLALSTAVKVGNSPRDSLFSSKNPARSCLSLSSIALYDTSLYDLRSGLLPRTNSSPSIYNYNSHHPPSPSSPPCFHVFRLNGHIYCQVSIHPRCRIRKLCQADRNRPHQTSFRGQTPELPFPRGRHPATFRTRNGIQQLSGQISQVDRLLSPHCPSRSCVFRCPWRGR
jgi:hypothetical protein